MHPNAIEVAIAKELNRRSDVLERLMSVLECADPKDGPALYRDHIGSLQIHVDIAQDTYHSNRGHGGTHPVVLDAEERLASNISCVGNLLHRATKKLNAWENAGFFTRLRRLLGW